MAAVDLSLSASERQALEIRQKFEEEQLALNMRDRALTYALELARANASPDTQRVVGTSVLVEDAEAIRTYLKDGVVAREAV